MGNQKAGTLSSGLHSAQVTPGQGGGWRGEDFLTLAQDCQSQLGVSDRQQPPAPKQTNVAANGGASLF